MSNKHRHRRRSQARASRARIVPGAAPGVLVAPPDSQSASVQLMAYSQQSLDEGALTDLGRLDEVCGSWPTVWLDVVGLKDIQLLEELGARFGLHPLALEDVVQVHQRPKVEVYEDHVFVVLRMPDASGSFATEQLSLFLGSGYVLTFQERPGDCLEPVRARLRAGRGRIRAAGSGYLAYALLDAVVDHFFPIIEHHGERVEAISDEVFRQPHDNQIFRIHEIKRDFMHLRRALFPLRETVNALLREDVPNMDDDTRVYLRDCYDHVIQQMDLVESYREVSGGLMEAYQSSVGFRTNEVMRVLTVFASIFIPLTFVAGIYGMNFDPQASPWNMPELRWAWGYPAFWAVMLAMSGSLLLYFQRKGWLGKPRSTRPQQ